VTILCDLSFVDEERAAELKAGILLDKLALF
jgi:hypothetical protein